MQYSPKKDALYALAIWSAPIIVLLFLMYSYSVALLVLFILTVLLFVWIWHSTRYEIRDGELIIQSWIFRRRVKIQDIVSVKKTKNLLASYALSRDRLEITEQNQDTYYIAPNDVDAFIAELKQYNPYILIG